MSDDDAQTDCSSLLFIDDDYADQQNLSLEPPDILNDQLFIYPSAASFPDIDLGIPVDPLSRERYLSQSDPDLPSHGCHKSFRKRWTRWTTALKAWSTTDIHVSSGSPRGEEEEEDEGAATPT